MAVSDPVDGGAPPGPKRVANAVEDLVPEKATAACKLEGVGKRFGSFRALQGLDLTIRRGERVGIVGASGAGKTTLLRLLNTSLFPTEGTVEILGADPTGLNPSGLRALRGRIGTVYQQLLLVPQVSVLQNVISGRLARTSLWKAAMSLWSRSEAERVAAVLDRVGLASKIYERVDRLSGGEQQRVAIARMLYQDPEMMIADEPVASVDPARSAAIIELLSEIAHGRTFLVSTHRLETVMPAISRVIALREGRIVFDKAKSQVSLDDLTHLYQSQKGSSTPARWRPLSPVEAPLGVVAIGASNTPGEFILPRLVSSFVKECPGVRVTLSVKATAEVTRDLLEGRLDLAFVGARTPQPGLHFEDFAEDEIILVASSAFGGLPPEPLSTSDVAKLTRVEREAGSGTRAVVEDHFANMGTPLGPESVALEVGTLVGLKAAVISGIGVAFSSRQAVQAELSSGLLREISIDSVKIPRQIFIAWRSDRELPPPARVFVSVARATWAALRRRSA
jgi:phosphonate transport system ATP-binding protein